MEGGTTAELISLIPYTYSNIGLRPGLKLPIEVDSDLTKLIEPPLNFLIIAILFLSSHIIWVYGHILYILYMRVVPPSKLLFFHFCSNSHMKGLTTEIRSEQKITII